MVAACRTVRSSITFKAASAAASKVSASRAEQLLVDGESVTALCRWMDRYADFVTTKQGMAEALRAVLASGAISSSHTRGRLSAAIQLMIDAGVAAGTLRDDVLAEDVSASLAGVLLAAGAPDQRNRPGGCSTCWWTACAGGRAERLTARSTRPPTGQPWRAGITRCSNSSTPEVS